MLKGFEDSIPLYSGGLYVSGKKYQVTKVDNQSMFAEQVRQFGHATRIRFVKL
jgi:profilin